MLQRRTRTLCLASTPRSHCTTALDPRWNPLFSDHIVGLHDEMVREAPSRAASRLEPTRGDTLHVMAISTGARSGVGLRPQEPLPGRIESSSSNSPRVKRQSFRSSFSFSFWGAVKPPGKWRWPSARTRRWPRQLLRSLYDTGEARRSGDRPPKGSDKGSEKGKKGDRKGSGKGKFGRPSTQLGATAPTVASAVH